MFRREYIKKVLILAAITMLVCTACVRNPMSGEGSLSIETSENAEDRELIKVRNELFQYKNMTYGQYKEKTGADVEGIRQEVFAGMISDSNMEIVFLASEIDSEFMYLLQEDDECYRLQGSVGELVDGIEKEMTVDEFVDSLSGKKGNPEYAFGEGFSAGFRISDLYVAIAFDSDADGRNDAILHIDITDGESIKPESPAWLFWDLPDDYVNM